MKKEIINYIEKITDYLVVSMILCNFAVHETDSADIAFMVVDGSGMVADTSRSQEYLDDGRSTGRT